MLFPFLTKTTATLSPPQLEGSWIPAGPPPGGVDDSTGAPQRPLLDDCEKMGTLFGMINKCLRGLGFSQMEFADRTVEPVVVLLFWLLLWFLGVQALGLVGALCIIIIYIQKD